MLPPLLVDAYALLFGLVVGSYLNVVIHRLPRRLPTIVSRSRCPICGSRIRAWENVPLLSYLLLRGRCARCGVRISARYPLVEAMTGLLFVACFRVFGVSVAALIGCGLCALLVALAGIDFDHYLLPDRLTLPGLAAGLAVQPWLPWGSYRGALIGALVGGGLLLAVWGLWYLIRREEGMGLGDAKMLAMIGAFLGWKGMAVAFLTATAAGSVVGLAAMASGRIGRRGKLPFGVFLALGAVVGLLWGHGWVERYLDLL